jgi:TP901 family phage tail tape measure protein
MNNRLEFIVSLLDRVSAPAGKVMKSLDQITKTAEAGYQRIGYGVAGLVGAGYSVAGLVEPAREMNKALNSVKALGAESDVLTQLNKQAKLFSIDFGDSAAEFVSSAGAIKSAIDGLVGDELSRFTYVGNLLAKGTEANATTITNYLSVMYGIFQQTADAMGRSRWVELMAGQTTLAAKIFKTNGQQMAEAFIGLGAKATQANIPMHEQMAVLGKLQSVYSGSEAATKYVSFLSGVGNAQEKLGLKLTDSYGRMLPIVEILDRIKGKFGQIDTVAEADLLQKAFGRKEAVDLIQLLMTDLGGLKNNIAEIGQVQGLDELTKMAQTMTDPIDRATAGATSLGIAIGQKMMASITPTLEKVIAFEKRMIGWTDQFPKLTALIGKGTLAVFGLIAAVSALSIAVGVGKFLMIGWTAGMGLMRGAIWLFMAPLKLWRLLMLANAAAGALWSGGLAISRALLLAFTVQLNTSRAAMLLWRVATMAAGAATAAWQVGLSLMGTAFGALKAMVLTALPAIWSFTTALLANPVGLVVAGVVAVGGALAASIIYWDQWTGAVIRWASIAGESIGLFAVVDSIIATWNNLPVWWNGFTAWLSGLNPLAALGASVDWLLGKFELVTAWWNGFTAWLSGLNPFAGLAASLEGLLSKVGQIPGVGPLMKAIAPSAPAPVPPLTFSGNVGANLRSNVPSGGILGQVGKQSGGRSIRDVIVNNYGQPMSGQQLANELAFAAP